jgi:hypothetical protein
VRLALLIASLIAVLAAPLLLARPAQAQSAARADTTATDSTAAAGLHPRRGDLGVGFLAGRPGGLTLRLYLRPRTARPQTAFDVLAASDLNAVTFLDVRLVRAHPLPDVPLRALLGGGAFVGNDGSLAASNAIFGLSTLVGLNFFSERFEVFLQLAPRLRLRPTPNGTFDGGAGLRYYL